MEDVITITSGFRADYYYRCSSDISGNIVERHYLYCRPHDGFYLFKVVGHYSISPDDDWCFHHTRYVIATDEQDAISQSNNDWRFKPSYALEVNDSTERKRVLSRPRYVV